MSAVGEEGVFLRALMITQVKRPGRDSRDNKGHYSSQRKQDNCDCDKQQMLKVREMQRCDLVEDVMFILDSLMSQVSMKYGVSPQTNWVSFITGVISVN